MKAILGLIALVLAVWLLGGSPVRAQSDSALSPEEQRGKKIYLKGESTSGEIKAVLGSSDLELAASAFPCANCHGLRGEGASEGGLQPPPLIWSKLTAAGRSALTRAARGPYDDATLARAITSGIDSAGGRLHPGMPQYKLSGGQMSDLIAYLKKLGREVDSDPGVSEKAIKVGSALPLTGPLARIGEDVKLALEAYFTEVNRQGGIYGRQFELVVVDSHGDPSGTLSATRRLVDEENVFALVGSFEPAASQSTNQLLRQREVPLVGPTTLSPRQPAVPNPYVFYLLPSFADQSRSLVDFISARPLRADARPAARLAVIYADNELNQDALSGLKSQAELHSMQIVVEQAYQTGGLAAASAVRSLAEKPVDAVFFFGNGDEFSQFAIEMDRAKLDARLLSSAIMIGRSAFSLPSGLTAKTFLAYPASLPDREDFGEFIAVMQKSGVPLRSAAFQAVAFAAAKIFVEAVKASTRQVNRADLIRALEQMHNYATGVIAPVTFGPNRRTGANGSYVVNVDVEKKQYVPASDRIVPKTRDQ